jgi:long-chain acyl-CoA synthetase
MRSPTDKPPQGGRLGLLGLTMRLKSVVGLRRSPRETVVEPPEAGAFKRPYPWESVYPPGLDWDMNIENATVPLLFDRAVESYGERPCLEFLGKRYSYDDVADLVERAAEGFRLLGVDKGVRVGLFLPNCPYFVVCYHAILKAGGIVVNFNPLYAEMGIARQIRDADVRIMVTMNLKTLYPKVEGRLDDTDLEKIVVCCMSAALPFPGNALFKLLKRKEMAQPPDDERHLRFEKLIDNEGDYEAAVIAPDDVALLQYTGGTTGRPKGAKLTHGHLFANAIQTRAWATRIGDGGEKILGVLPLFHAFGMTGVMNVGFNIGAEILLVPRFKADETLRVIAKERPTILMGVPTMFSAINGHKDAAKIDMSCLKFCISGGAALPDEVKQKFEDMTDCVLVEGYGLTESGPVATINPIDGINKPGSAGLPIPGTAIKIVSLEDPARAVALGEPGEVCIAGPQVMCGYWERDEESAEAVRDGWLYTGDVGYLDGQGYLFLMDRIKDMIITGGFNVYPRMVEDAICLHPSVREAAVCGVPSTHHGEIVKAYVVLDDGARLTASALRAFLKDKLASFEMPRRVEFVDEVPKTLLGKPLRRELIAAELRRATDSDARAEVEAEEEEGVPT